MKTKKIYTIAVISLFLTGRGLGENEFNMNQANEHIETMIGLKLHEEVTDLNVQYRQAHIEFITFRNLCKTNWQKILEKFDDLTGEEDGKKLTMEAFQWLPPEDYIQAFEWMVGKLIANEFKKENIILFMDSSGLMSNFLTDNYQHPRVVSALNQLKSKVGENEEISNDVNSILNGKSKEMLDNYREAHEGMPEGDIPVIILPP